MKDIFPNLNPTVKGISLAFLATLGMANVYVFSKAAQTWNLLNHPRDNQKREDVDQGKCKPVELKLVVVHFQQSGF